MRVFVNPEQCQWLLNCHCTSLLPFYVVFLTFLGASPRMARWLTCRFRSVTVNDGEPLTQAEHLVASQGPSCLSRHSTLSWPLPEIEYPKSSIPNKNSMGFRPWHSSGHKKRQAIVIWKSIRWWKLQSLGLFSEFARRLRLRKIQVRGSRSMEHNFAQALHFALASKKERGQAPFWKIQSIFIGVLKNKSPHNWEILHPLYIPSTTRDFFIVQVTPQASHGKLHSLAEKLEAPKALGMHHAQGPP